MPESLMAWVLKRIFSAHNKTHAILLCAGEGHCEGFDGNMG